MGLLNLAACDGLFVLANTNEMKTWPHNPGCHWQGGHIRGGLLYMFSVFWLNLCTNRYFICMMSNFCGKMLALCL